MWSRQITSRFGWPSSRPALAEPLKPLAEKRRGEGYEVIVSTKTVAEGLAQAGSRPDFLLLVGDDEPGQETAPWYLPAKRMKRLHVAPLAAGRGSLGRNQQPPGLDPSGGHRPGNHLGRGPEVGMTPHHFSRSARETGALVFFLGRAMSGPGSEFSP